MRTTASLISSRLAAEGSRSLRPRRAARRPGSRSDAGPHGVLLDEGGELRQHAGICLGEHAVAEVEDVSAPLACSLEHVESRLLDARPRPEQHCRVEIPLNTSVADGVPAEIER